MSAAPRFVLPYQTVIDAAGVPLPGALLNFYLTGSDTRANTYSNSTLTIANANPVPAGADGRFPAIFLDPAVNYKVVLTDATGATIWTADPVSGWFGFATNYAALRGLTTTTSNVVYVIGAATPHDGGQGWFSYDPTDTTSLDNGGTTIVAGTVRWKRLYDGPIYPEWFGAKGDGTTPNDAAFALVLATGLPFAGTDGSIYGLANPLDFSAVTKFSAENITFKDLTPGASDRRFLYGSGNAAVRMNRLKVLRNGTGAGGSLGNNSAIWIASATYIDMTDVEVTGNDAGSGIRLVSCAAGSLTRAFVHDMLQGTPSSPNPGDGTDQIIGIWSVASLGVTIDDCTVRDLLTQCVDYGPENINTRGITLGGTGVSTVANAVAVTDCFVSNVDEGYDYTGDQWPVGIATTACRAEYCRKFGFKDAVTVLGSTYTGCTAFRCTLAGFYIQGGSVNPQTQGIRLVNCVAIASGYNVATYYSSGSTTCGFRCDYGVADMTHPRNVVFDGCRAYGGTEMKFGFLNSIGDLYTANDRNRLINCSTTDFTELAQEGFVVGYSFIGLEANQSIPSGVDTAIIFDRAHDSIDGFHFLVGTGELRTPTANIVFPYDCLVQITCSTPFVFDPLNNTGVRSVVAKINGGTFSPTRDIRNPTTTTQTTPNFTVTRQVAAGDVLNIVVFQDSGVALDVDGGNTGLFIVDLASGQQLILSA